MSGWTIDACGGDDNGGEDGVISEERTIGLLQWASPETKLVTVAPLSFLSATDGISHTRDPPAAMNKASKHLYPSQIFILNGQGQLDWSSSVKTAARLHSRQGAMASGSSAKNQSYMK